MNEMLKPLLATGRAEGKEYPNYQEYEKFWD